MGTVENLKSVIDRQKQVLSELETEWKALEGSDLAKENAALKTELEKLRFDLEKVSNNAALLADDNARYKNALYEQIYNEKVKIVNTTAQKVEAYFRSGIDGELNRLVALEYSVVTRINNLRETIARYNLGTEHRIRTLLDEASYLVSQKVEEARAYAAQTTTVFSAGERASLEALKNEQLSDEQIREVTRKNNFERFVGLNVFNAAGILLLIVGAVALALFAYFRLPDVFKGVLIFLLGGVMLSAGEMMNRKKPTVFSLGLSAGGIGILYTAMIMSYLNLRILDALPTVLVCTLITTGAFILSNRYNSQTISVFALVGGYLPVFAFTGSTSFGTDTAMQPGGSDMIMIYGAMVYFVALNLFALLISTRKKWRITMFIGLFLNIVGTATITGNYPTPENALLRAPLILYILFAFLVYTFIPIISTYQTKVKFRASDVFLLAVNTVFSSVIIFVVFGNFGMEKYFGLLAVVIAAIYLFFGRYISRKFAGEERAVSALFYMTGFVFVVLFVPLQFGEVWLSLGWMIEGVLLAAYGILKSDKRFKAAGFIVYFLCLLVFLIFDAGYISFMNGDLFLWKYLAVTLGSLAILGAYMHKKMLSGLYVAFYMFCTLANAWIFSLYLIFGALQKYLFSVYGSGRVFELVYLLFAAAIAATFFYAYLFQRIKLLSLPVVRALSIIMYITGVIMLLVINSIAMPVVPAYFGPGTPHAGATLAGVAILAAIGALSVFAVRDLMRIIVAGRRVGVEWYPMVISGYSIIIVTHILIAQFGLSFSSMALSILYALTALAWIVFGFSQRYTFIRRFGLGLALFSVVKLVLIDLSQLAEGYRIISYFVLGGTLVAISYVYQYFSKLMELKDAGAGPGGEALDGSSPGEEE